MKRQTVLIAAGATLAVVYGIYRTLKSVSEGLVEDAVQALYWLAKCHPALATYEPPASSAAMRAVHPGPRVDALVVHGCSMVAVPVGAADLFVDVLHPAGCRTVVLTGGVGRETLPLWTELADRDKTSIFGSSWVRDSSPTHVSLPTQCVASKPVLDGFDVAISPEELRTYASEADVFLELFSARCRERGLQVEFGGNPMSDDGVILTSNAVDRVARVYLETASTHTGTNVEYSRSTLERLGMTRPVVAVVQQPQLHRRTCLTWEKQTGVAPIGWTVQPNERTTGRSRSEMLLYALGELRRIPSYASDKGFCMMPEDYPHALLPLLESLEGSITMAVEMEKQAKTAKQ